MLPLTNSLTIYRKKCLFVEIVRYFGKMITSNEERNIINKQVTNIILSVLSTTLCHHTSVMDSKNEVFSNELLPVFVQTHKSTIDTVYLFQKIMKDYSR